MSVLKADSVIDMYKNQKKPIDVRLNDYLKSEIQNNREKIKPIIDTLILCGRQDLATRGHHDSGRIDVKKELNDENDGNFRALLRYRVEGGDLMLKKHLWKHQIMLLI